MKTSDDFRSEGGTRVPVIVQTSSNFRLDVLEKLGRLDAKVDMLVGNGQPGRMRLAEDRITFLERNDIRRTVYDRITAGFIAFVVSALITLHDHFVVR